MSFGNIFKSLFGTKEAEQPKQQPVQQQAAPQQSTPRQPQQPSTNKQVSFTFAKIPGSVEEFCSLPEMDLQTPFKTAALTLLALLEYEKNAEEAIKMLNVLRGPEPMSPYDKQFIKDRLTGKMHKPRSFFKGATPQNNYTPSVPYQCTIVENPYSYPQENYATMWVQSSGADSLRQIMLRKKPSTGEWFLRDIQCLADIRIPVAEDKWA